MCNTNLFGFGNLTCLERQCWKEQDSYLENVELEKTELQRELQNPAEEGFVRTFMSAEMSLTCPSKETNFSDMTRWPYEISPPAPHHHCNTLARPYISLHSCNVLQDWGSTTHERYPWHQCKSHTLCLKHVVKFRYKITEEKHINTTVKSSHQRYGKIVGIEYWGTRHWLKIGSYPLQHWGFLVDLAVNHVAFLQADKERTMYQQNTL